MRNPSDRDREMVGEMLRQFRAAQETLLRSSGGGSGNVPLMPRTWTPEMRELERCLGVLARCRPGVHRQVMARFVDPVLARRTMVGRLVRRGGGDVMVWPQLGGCAEVRSFAKLPEHEKSNQYSCLVASWPSWVNKVVVNSGIEFLVGEFVVSGAVGPALPAEMLAA